MRESFEKVRIDAKYYAFFAGYGVMITGLFFLDTMLDYVGADKETRISSSTLAVPALGLASAAVALGMFKRATRNVGEAIEADANPDSRKVFNMA